MYIDTFVPKLEKKKMNYSQIFLNYVKGHKDFNTLKLYALKPLLSKNQFYFFSQLLTCTNPIIYWDTMVLALILLLSFLSSLHF